MQKYYLDTCIWLNLFKKEGDASKGISYWKIAERFIEKVMFSESKEIIYTGFVLKEMKYKLDKATFDEKTLFLARENKFRFVKAIQEDYSLAQKLESEFKYRISFFDCMHIAVCKRLDTILITRDKELLKFAKKYLVAKKPEDLFNQTVYLV